MGIGDHPDRPKDTAVNIQREKEFVVNLVPEALAQSMSDSATDYPAHVSEIDILELATLSSTWVKPPRLAGCPASLECRLERVLMIGENRIIFGEVLGVHVLDDVVSDASKCQIASEQMQLIGRMGGLGGYTRTTDIFQIPRKKHTGS